MLLSYQKLELDDLAADTQKIIDYNDFSDTATTVDPDKYGPGKNIKAPPSTL